MTYIRQLLLTTVIATSGVISANAADYTLDPTHSFVEFRVKHLGYSWLPGRFNTLSGQFTYDAEGTVEEQSISIKVDTASIDSNHAKRDEHLREIIETADFSEASFISTSYKGDASGGVMHGDLTLHGVTKPVVINVKPIGEGKDPWGGYRAGFEGDLVFDRRDYGLDYDLGPASWDVELSLYIEGIRK